MSELHTEAVVDTGLGTSAQSNKEPKAIIIHQRLVTQKEKINQTIREYPRPITACDEQFNLLLEKRVSITQEIIRLERIIGHKAPKDNPSQEIPSEQLETFVTSSAFLTHT